MLSNRLHFPTPIAPAPSDPTPAQTVNEYYKDLHDRSMKLIEVQAFLDVLREELEAGTLQITGEPGFLDYTLERLNKLTA